MTEHIAEHAERYWRRELEPSEMHRIEAHMAECETCRIEIESVRDVVSALVDWGNVAPKTGRDEERFIGPGPTVAASPWWRIAAVAALCVAAAAAGYGAGVSRTSGSGTSTVASTTADTTLPVFLLLLEEAAWPPSQPLARPGYREWTTELVSARRFAGARKLTEEPGIRVASDGSLVPAGPDERVQNLSGWYLIRARNYEEAIAFARRGPHLRYGSILVRQVE